MTTLESTSHRTKAEDRASIVYLYMIALVAAVG